MRLRRRLGLVLAVLLGLPSVGAVAVYFWINHLADQRWAAAQDRIRRLSASFPEGDSRGESPPGSEAAKENQIHFVAAIRTAASSKIRLFEVRRLLWNPAGGESVDAMLEEAQDFLDRVHEGARRIAAAPADFPPRWRGTWDPNTVATILHCGILRVRRQRERNVPIDVEALLDSLQLARFWAISGHGSSRGSAISNMPLIFEELRELLASGACSPDQARQVDRELAMLEGLMQSPLRALEWSFARWGELLVSENLPKEALREDTPYLWKYLIPERLLKAEGYEFAERHFRSLIEAESGGYVELQQRCRRLDREAASSRNPIIRRMSQSALRIDWIEIECQAELRLLRSAARYRGTGEFLSLEDPYGKILLHSDQGSTVRFWSVGGDGRDDGGHWGGDQRWSRLYHTGADQLAKDLVIEVPRRP